MPYTRRFPIVLASKSHITTLIIRDEHLRNLHAGAQALLNSLSEILDTLCAIHDSEGFARVYHVFPSDREGSFSINGKPAVRVTPSRAFLNVRVDYGGPFHIKISRNKTAKAYLCLFICLATRAIHLEVATDLSTTVFLNALKCFIVRRDKNANIYSDNESTRQRINNDKLYRS